jgi:hypothetical protein
VKIGTSCCEPAGLELLHRVGQLVFGCQTLEELPQGAVLVVGVGAAVEVHALITVGRSYAEINAAPLAACNARRNRRRHEGSK